jgi:hypothetical protein
MAVRIPSGWLLPEAEVTLERDAQSGEIRLTQRTNQANLLLRSWLDETELVDEVFDAALKRELILDWQEAL